MAEYIDPTVLERLRDTFHPEREHPITLTPHAVAGALRTLGQQVSDSYVLEVYEQLRAWSESGPVAEAKKFLAEHHRYEEWKQAVAHNQTLAGFFEWREQQ